MTHFVAVGTMAELQARYRGRIEYARVVAGGRYYAVIRKVE